MKAGIILVAATILCFNAYADEKPKLAVMNITAEQGIAEGTVKILNEMLLTEVQATGRFSSVIGQRDIIAMITLESLRLKLSECSDESCLAEIGGALGVGHLLSGNMGRVGKKFVLNLKLINVKATRVEARTSITTEPSEDELISALKKSAREVLAGFGVQPIREEETSLAPWLVLGGASAMAIGGAILGGLAMKDRNDLEGMAWDDPGRGSKEDAVSGKSLAADVMFGLAIAGAATTVILLLIDGDEERPAVTPSPGGAALRF